jgi:hypothetical protein
MYLQVKNKELLDEWYEKFYLSDYRRKNLNKELVFKLRAILLASLEKKFLTNAYNLVTKDDLLAQPVLAKYPVLKEFPNWCTLQKILHTHNKFAFFSVDFINNKKIDSLPANHTTLFKSYYSNFPEFCFSDFWLFNYIQFDLNSYLPNKEIFSGGAPDIYSVYDDLPEELREIYYWIIIAILKNDQHRPNSVFVEKKTGKVIDSDRFMEFVADDSEEKFNELTDCRAFSIIEFLDALALDLANNFKEKNYFGLANIEEDFDFYFDIFLAILVLDKGFLVMRDKTNSYIDRELAWQYLFTALPYTLYSDIKRLCYAINRGFYEQSKILWFGRPFTDKADLCHLLFLHEDMYYIGVTVNIYKSGIPDVGNILNVDFTDTKIVQTMEETLMLQHFTLIISEDHDPTIVTNFTSSILTGNNAQSIFEKIKKSKQVNYMVSDFKFKELFPVVKIENNEIGKSVYFIDNSLDEVYKEILNLESLATSRFFQTHVVEQHTIKFDPK